MKKYSPIFKIKIASIPFSLVVLLGFNKNYSFNLLIDDEKEKKKR